MAEPSQRGAGPGGPWFTCPPQAAGAIRLYCFSHAGGNALGFIPWRSRLDPRIELVAVQLPGRGRRAAEPACTGFDELVASVAAEIDRHAGMPCAFFGHSMGALLAFEVARACRRAAPDIGHLLLSGCAAPRALRPPAGLPALTDAALEAALGHHKLAPPQLLQMRALMLRALPAIRADLALMNSYRYRPGALLARPLTVLYGSEDRLVRPQQVDGWGEETTAPWSRHGFEGDHFFVDSCRPAVLALVERVLLQQPAPLPGPPP